MIDGDCGIVRVKVTLLGTVTICVEVKLDPFIKMIEPVLQCYFKNVFHIAIINFDRAGVQY